MTKKWWTKFYLLMVVTVLSVLYVIPTFTKMNAEKSVFPFSKKINLGLDLQGGLYLVMGVDFNKVFKEIADRQMTSFQERLKEKNIPVTDTKLRTEGVPGDDPRIQFKVATAQKAALKDLIQSDFHNMRITDEKTEGQADSMEIALSHDYRNDIRDRTLNQSIEVIRNRIDEFGVSEPQISSQGTDRVVIELPGIKDVDRAKDLIGRTAKLEFKMVDEDGMQKTNLPELLATIEKEKGISFKEGSDSKFSEHVKALNEAAKGKIPEGSEIAFEKQGAARVPMLLKSKVDVTGNDLTDAQVGFDNESRRPLVTFELNPKGAITFERITGENIGHRLAIVLDGIIHSAPSINSKIGARGQITTGRGGYDEALRESKDLAIVLRAGALPAQLELMEQRVVGPSLGADSVSKGAYASLLGILAVFLLTIIYYRISGMIAVVSLLMNVILVLAILVWLEATLTLPGIAGIALTVGIAVDSNVVIYERIREELTHGKPIGAAVEAGFDKAFKTILDANVANGIAAIILMIYGTGPVKGFAVTMIIGILTTLFTAVFVCRVLFDLYLKRLQDQGEKNLSI